jgi:hypothetical protein
MITRFKRGFQFESVRLEIEEVMTDQVSGDTQQHGSHLWPSSG